MTAPAPELLHGLTRLELQARLESLGQPAYRAAQVWGWLYAQRATEWETMTNLPRPLLDLLQGAFTLASAREAEAREAPDGTVKLLARLADGDAVETVVIPAGARRTVCVSTQLGCARRCAFCASGQAGLRRNLQAGEIVGQVVLAARRIGDRPSNVVFMGIGEPLDNYDATLKAARILNDAEGMNIGARRITISTCGVVPGIERLAGEGLQVELSVSLHAPDDASRSRLMPVNRQWPLAVLMAACRDYTQRTGRIVTFEYTLVAGVNDSRAQAAALARLVKGAGGRVNLIPLSPVAEYAGAAPAPEAARAFSAALTAAGVHNTLRSSRGAAVGGACGQLRFAARGPA
jgi:23S rRNA (adenine2503-C2)-methyltransferase